jgi:Asp-tRNA(Asn)/Glu-tRNA(Gln) amidotransferase A subunit family amidase
MSELADLSASKLRNLIESRECSCEDIVKSCFGKIRKLEPTVKAFVEYQEDSALEQARQRDQSPSTGLLHGIPVAVKDTVDVAGMRCTWGTEIHASRVPSSDSVVVQRLRDAGAIIVGTTVTTEYAIAKAGPTTNPHNAAHTPGGSSSGSGAAVAARMVPIAVATQSVGSIIRPSSFCGVFGMKPTLGAVSGQGVMPISERLDHIGPMARTVKDIDLSCRVMLEGNRLPSKDISLDKLPAGTRVLRVDGPLSERIEPPTAEALKRAQKAFEDAGVTVMPVELPSRFSRLITCYETIVFRDLALNHKSDFEKYGSRMSPRLNQIMTIGLGVTPAAYDAAMDDAAYYRNHIGELLTGNTVILTPATDGYAPVMSDSTGEQKLQSLWTVAGVPSLATPCGKRDGLPISVQVVGAARREDLVLAAAQIVESVYGNESML